MEKETCVECASQFSKRANLLAHIKRKHPDKLQNAITASSIQLSTDCPDCSMHFSKLSNLRRHMRNKHSGKSDTVCPKKTYKAVANCDVCEKPFSSVDNLTKHLRLKHSDTASHKCNTCHQVFGSKNNLENHSKIHNPKHFLKCPLCDYCSNKKELINHYAHSHNIQVESCDFEFSSSEEFLRWKREMEIGTVASYVKSHGSYNTEKFVKTIYVCNRSGNVRLRGHGVRRLKTQGSNKINGYCPSCVEVYEEPEKYRVCFVKTHIGHTEDLQHIFLNPEDKQQLATQIATGVPFKNILSQARVSESASQRIHLLTRKDLYNLQSLYHLNSAAVPHGCDAFPERKKKMIGDFVRLIENSETMEELDALEKCVTPMGPTLEAIRQGVLVSPALVEEDKEIPHNRKIATPKRLFYSRKKTKKIRPSKKPAKTAIQSDNIIVQLLNA